MSKTITVTVADAVYEFIEQHKGKNRSAFTEELIRKGMSEFERETSQKSDTGQRVI